MAAPLDPHPSPLTAADARHLLRRTGFGAPPSRVKALTGMSAAAAARFLLDEAASSTVPDPGWYGTAVTNQNTTFNTERENILRRMATFGLREKMTLFWHNHFPVEASVVNVQANVVLNGVTTTVYYTPAIMWTYYRLLRDNALGNFRTVVGAIGKEVAMLRYLNGNQSTRTAPNQNYGRELLELFTMGIYDSNGQRNYTDTNTDGNSSDVYMAARALTGWRDRFTPVRNGVTTYTMESYLDTSNNFARIDRDMKTFLGQIGTWGYDDVIRIIFEERAVQTAHYLSRKLLSFFVAAVPDAEAEDALAGAMTASGFEMRPVLETLFASSHFYSPGYRGALVRSPTDLYLGLMGDLGADFGAATFNWPQMRTYCQGNVNVEERSHRYFEPPNVAGWPGHNPPNSGGRENFKVWYAAEDFSTVWNNLRGAVNGRFGQNPYAFAAALAPDPNDAAKITADPFQVARAVAEHLIAIPLPYASIPDKTSTPYAGDLVRNPVPAYLSSEPRYVQDLAKIMLGGVPWYEWPSMPTDGPGLTKTSLLRVYLQYLATEVPEVLLF